MALGKCEEEIKEQDYYHKEIRMGKFERIVHLPSGVKEEEVSATYKDGVLKIILPKKTSSKSKKIKIHIK